MVLLRCDFAKARTAVQKFMSGCSSVRAMCRPMLVLLLSSLSLLESLFSKSSKHADERPDHACKTLNDGLVNLEKVRAFVKLLDVPNTSQAPANRPMWRTTGRHQETSFMKHSQSPHLPVHHVCTGGLQHNGTWPLCLEELSQPCLVYSFGIANEWTFDEAAADAGCEVHSFDPTLASLRSHRSHKYRGVTFHPWGLQSDLPNGCRREEDRTTAGGYGKLSNDLFSLRTIMQRLGHEKRRITMLKADCEGCEWDAFFQMAFEEEPALEKVYSPDSNPVLALFPKVGLAILHGSSQALPLLLA